MWTPLTVEKRAEQLDKWLSEAIAKLQSDGELLISKIPPHVRNVKMGDLQNKYGGDITAIKEVPQKVMPEVIKSRKRRRRCERCRCRYLALFIALPTFTP